MRQAMAGSKDSLLDEATRLLRELAAQQGLAYSTYGETLQRFGKNEIGWTDLFKASGDIYFKEAAQTVWSLVRANGNFYAWMLSMAGARVPRSETKPDKSEAQVGAPPKRGRR
jgi:hypothetical protein